MTIVMKLLKLAAFGTGLFGVITYDRAYDSWWGALGLTITAVLSLAILPTKTD